MAFPPIFNVICDNEFVLPVFAFVLSQLKLTLYLHGRNLLFYTLLLLACIVGVHYIILNVLLYFQVVDSSSSNTIPRLSLGSEFCWDEDFKLPSESDKHEASDSDSSEDDDTDAKKVSAI